MSNKNKNVPTLRFKEFEGEWENKLFGDLYSFKKTNSLSRDKLNYDKGTVKNIHYGDIHKRFNAIFNIKDEKVPFINSDIDLSKIALENYCEEGDLVIADASEDYSDIGKTIEIKSLNNEKVLAGLHTFLARRKFKLATGFIAFLFKNHNVKLKVMRIAQGTKVLSISTKRLSKIPLPFPSLAEQKKIATFLTAIDKRLQLLEQKKERLEQYKKGVMQQLFSQAIRFKKDDGTEYEDWEEKKLGEILIERKEFAIKSEGLEHISLTKKGVVPKSNRYMRDFLVNNDDTKKYKITKLNDICYNPANLKFGVICRNKYGLGIFSPIYITFEVLKNSYIFMEYFLTRKDFITKARKYEEGTVYELSLIHI